MVRKFLRARRTFDSSVRWGRRYKLEWYVGTRGGEEFEPRRLLGTAPGSVEQASLAESAAPGPLCPVGLTKAYSQFLSFVFDHHGEVRQLSRAA